MAGNREVLATCNPSGGGVTPDVRQAHREVHGGEPLLIAGKPVREFVREIVAVNSMYFNRRLPRMTQDVNSPFRVLSLNRANAVPRRHQRPFALEGATF